MATIGLDKLFYASITEDKDGNETYGTPVQLAKAKARATFYCDLIDTATRESLLG